MIYNTKDLGTYICKHIEILLNENNNSFLCFNEKNKFYTLEDLLKHYYVALINKLHTYEIAFFSDEYIITKDDKYYNLNDFKLVYIIDHNSLSIGCNGNIFFKVIKHSTGLKDEDYTLEFINKLFL